MNEGSMSGNKRSFIMGLITGVVVLGLLGGVFMLGQKFGSGAPLAANNNNPTAPTANDPGAQAPEGDATKIKPVSKDDHIRGDANAPITMIEYSDFECPFCLQFHETLTQVMKDYQGKVRIVYRQFPLRQIHPQAQKSAEASECAAVQGKFWEMHDKLFALNQTGTISVDNMKKAAAELKLNTSKFNTCLDNGEAVNAVEEDYQDGIAGGVRGTPGTFINGQYIPGALPLASIKSTIDSLLN